MLLAAADAVANATMKLMGKEEADLAVEQTPLLSQVIVDLDQ